MNPVKVQILIDLIRVVEVGLNVLEKHNFAAEKFIELKRDSERFGFNQIPDDMILNAMNAAESAIDEIGRD